MPRKHPLEVYRQSGSRFGSEANEKQKNRPKGVTRPRKKEPSGRTTRDRRRTGKSAPRKRSGTPAGGLIQALKERFGRGGAAEVEGDRRRMALLAVLMGLLLVLAVFLGYNWGFHSGWAKAKSGDGDESALAAKRSADRRSEWSPASQRSGYEGQSREATDSEASYRIRLVSYAESQRSLAEDWKDWLIDQGVPDVGISRHAGGWLLLCGAASSREELGPLLKTVRSLTDNGQRIFESAEIGKVTPAD